MGVRSLDYLPHYTYEDYLAFEGKWEIINGIAYAMSPAPIKTHQRISQRIGFLLEEMLQECPHCVALLPVDYKIDEDTIVQPDNLVVCDESMEGAYITKAPLIIFEVLSKSTAIKDKNLKFELYEREGVRYYCMVDPDEKLAKLYRWHEGRYIKAGDFDREVFAFEIDGCEMPFDFSKIWG